MCEDLGLLCSFFAPDLVLNHLDRTPLWTRTLPDKARTLHGRMTNCVSCAWLSPRRVRAMTVAVAASSLAWPLDFRFTQARRMEPSHLKQHATSNKQHAT